VNENHQRVTQQERESVKEKYAEGNEYFIHTGKIHPGANLINVLKAFSAFKKRQKSGMQLLIITNGGKYYERFLSTVSLFKFKEDVNILNGLTQNEISKITASAYALVHPSFFESFGSSLIDAMKYDVPIITSLTGAMPEICGDAALYADPENFKDIAVKMMTLFKDENLRKELIEKGKLQVQKYNWNITAELVWNSIEKTIGL
jgi:glycosyltransferase involved in cell wall biosynthesis